MYEVKVYKTDFVSRKRLGKKKKTFFFVLFILRHHVIGFSEEAAASNGINVMIT